VRAQDKVSLESVTSAKGPKGPFSLSQFSG